MISILIPTKGRPESLKRCIKSIDVPAKVIVVASHLSDIFGVEVKDFIVDSSLNPVQAQLEAYKKAEGHILIACDDIEFMPGAIQKALDMLGDGIVGFNQINIPGGSQYAFMLISEAYHKEFGYFHKHYKHFFADTEYGEQAKERGRFKFGAECHVKHYHPSATKQPDATHNNNRMDKLSHDMELYELRKAHR